MKKALATLIITAIVGAGLFFSLNGQKQSNHNENNSSVFTVATWNVENLFDMVADGGEYVEYIPNYKGWDNESYQIKLRHTAKVIADINADIIALEEVENKNAMNALVAKTAELGVKYPFVEITSNKHSTIQTVILSKYPILSKQEFGLDSQIRERPILKTVVDVSGQKLILYANHWKAKTGPESRRIEYAKSLMQDVSRLPMGTDYIILGDFNSNYNEFETFENNNKLNDTMNTTGINDIVNTITQKNSKKAIATKVDVIADETNRTHYNLWLELAKNERISEYFGKEKNTPDNIIIPKAMFDNKGIAYLDHSFKIFAPSYLTDGQGRPFRWKPKDKNGFKSADGYSDHLPLLAKFSLLPFEVKDDRPAAIQAAPVVAQTQNIQTTAKKDGLSQKTIAYIYDKNISGKCDFLIKNCVAIYQAKSGWILKEDGGRAIFVYAPKQEMKLGWSYDIRVTQVDEFNGQKEIKQLFDARENKQASVKALLLDGNKHDLQSSAYQNEIVTGLVGYVSKGKFVYGDGKEINIYFADKGLRPKNLTKIKINAAHLGFFKEPQLIINSKSDFGVID
jgi:endonuclease/exonuclease/phosphatase family metal-dependent hydrolase